MKSGLRLPVAWTPLGSLVLSDGTLLDPRTGSTTTREARPPADASTRSFADGEAASSWAWTTDGQRIAYLAERTDVQPTVAGEMRRRAAFVADAAGGAARVVLHDPADGRPIDDVAERMYLMHGRFAWSSGGDRLFFRLEYTRVGDRGPDEVERVGCYEVARARTLVLEEFTRLDGASDQRTGRDVWDAAGRTFVYLGAVARAWPEFGRPWAGSMDLRVGDALTGGVRTVTTDGGEKGQPCIDPAGTRVAFFVGTGAGRRRSVPDAAAPTVRLRVVDLGDGSVWDAPLAPPPDAGDPLGELRWTPGGEGLVYGYGGIEGATYLQAVPPRPR